MNKHVPLQFGKIGSVQAYHAPGIPKFCKLQKFAIKAKYDKQSKNVKNLIAWSQTAFSFKNFL